MIKTDNVVPLLDASAQYKDFKLYINSINLRPQDILDFQVDFGQVVKGRLSFVDTLNVVESAPVTVSVINASYTDSAGANYKASYIVTEVQVIRLKNNSINVVMNFEDIRINALDNSYISRSFSNMTMLQMLESIFKEINVPALFHHYSNDYVYEHFVFPANISLLQFIKKQIPYSNIRMYTDRNEIIFIPRNVYDFTNIASTVEPPFTLNRRKDLPWWNILEYDGKISNNKEVRKAANADMHQIEPNALKYNPEPLSITTVYESQTVNKFMGMGTSTTLTDIVNTIGKREISHLFHNEIKGQDQDYRDIINRGHTVHIAVIGINLVRLFTKVDIQLPRAASIQTQEFDEVYSATFVVTEVIDKIIAGNFVQFLRLSVSDYGSGSSHLWK